MGATGCGKTSVSPKVFSDALRTQSKHQFINVASRSSLKVGKNLQSCTPDVQVADEFTIDGRRVLLVDTPGFDDTTQSDTAILKEIAAFLTTT